MSQMTYTQAAGEVRKMLRGFQAIQEVSDALDSIGSLENAASEAQARLEAANKFHEAVVASTASVSAELQEQRDAAKAECNQIKESAKNSADRIKDKAAAILTDAEDRSQEMDKQVALWKDELSTVKAELIVTKTELDALIKSRDEIKAQMQAAFK